MPIDFILALSVCKVNTMLIARNKRAILERLAVRTKVIAELNVIDFYTEESCTPLQCGSELGRYTALLLLRS